MQFNRRLPAKTPGLLTKVVTIIMGAVLLVSAAVISLFVLAVAAAVALLIGGYIWWKTRDIRKQFREQATQRPAPRNTDRTIEAEIIEGEVIRSSADDDRVPERGRGSSPERPGPDR